MSTTSPTASDPGQPEVSFLAVAAILCALSACLAFVGLPLGLLAYARCRRDGRAGGAIALGAITLSLFWIVFASALGVGAMMQIRGVEAEVKQAVADGLATGEGLLREVMSPRLREATPPSALRGQLTSALAPLGEFQGLHLGSFLTQDRSPTPAGSLRWAGGLRFSGRADPVPFESLWRDSPTDLIDGKPRQELVYLTLDGQVLLDEASLGR